MNLRTSITFRRLALCLSFGGFMLAGSGLPAAGVDLEAGFRNVKIHFPAAGETRVYMRDSAPLRRARLRVGDRARGRAGEVFVIRAVKEAGGLFTYCGDTGKLPEQELLDRMSFTDPDKRLLAGQLSKPRAISLRLRTQEFQLTVVPKDDIRALNLLRKRHL